MIQISSETDTDSALMAYPGFGYPVGGNCWQLQISGIAWQTPITFTMRQRMMIRMLGGVMQATADELNSERFQARIRPFMAEANSRQSVIVTIGKKSYRLPKKTRRNGRFADWLKIVESDLQPNIENINGNQVVRFSIALNDSSETTAEGIAYLFRPGGISVVSDIDDTIKDSAVGDRRELLANTFLREFRAIEGMAELYQDWERIGTGFHYVSSSPWQLFQPLSELQTVLGFPSGTMHLKNFRLRDQLLKRVIIRRQGKTSTIAKLLKHMPERDVVLIGDSGEKDPKIYRKICKKFPGRVKAVFIREVEYKPFTDEKIKKIQDSMIGGFCARFSSAEELRELANPIFKAGKP